MNRLLERHFGIFLGFICGVLLVIGPARMGWIVIEVMQ